MNRRHFLAAAGAAGLGALAGCSSSGGGGSPTPDGSGLTLTPGPTQGDSLPADQDPTDGYPPAFDEQPPEQDLGEERFAPYTVDGGSVMNASEDVTVTLAPIQVAYYWYARGEARFVDARGPNSYETSHVYGAVSSPAGTAADGSPVAEWPTGDRVVCYCTCPHHLSSIRAAELKQYGFENVYIIDEGFAPWMEELQYPVEGIAVGDLVAPTYVDGATDPADAGKTAWAYHLGTDYVEATKIDPNGGYRLALRVADEDARIRVETPSYEVTDSLTALADGTVADPAA